MSTLTRRSIFALVGLGLWAGTAPVTLAQGDFQSAAQTWLGLVDTARYGDSWDAASAIFRGAVPKASWEQQLRGVRQPLGPVVSRALKNATHATSLPGVPDGEYEVIQYQTNFQNKASATETVTMMQDGGVWKAAGYFIR